MNKQPLTLGIFFVLSMLILSGNASAKIAVYTTFNIESSSAYVGDTVTGALFIRNDNDMCDINCQYYNSATAKWTSISKLREKIYTTEYISFTGTTPGSATYQVTVKCQADSEIGCAAQLGSDREYSRSMEDSVDFNPHPVSVSVSVSPSSISLNSCLKTSEVTLSVKNNGDTSVQCQYKKTDGGWQSLGGISSGSSQASQIKITADGGSSMDTYPIEIKCTDDYGYSGTDISSVTVSYSVHPAESAIKDLDNTLTYAKGQIKAAESEIQKANNIGADTTSASGYLQKAKSSLSQAETDYKTASLSYQSTACEKAESQAQNGKILAQQIKNDADNAYNLANEAVKILEEKKKKAANSISMAETRISEAQTWIDNGQSIIGKAKDILKTVYGEGKWDRSTNLGMEGIQSEADINSASSNLENAKTYLSQANTAFQSNNYDLTEQNAQTCLSVADSSKNTAYQAHNKLYATLERANVAYNEMAGAQTEIQNINKIYNVLSEIVRAAKKDANMSSIESEITNLKAVIDSSQDYYSQAQNKFSAGSYEESVNLATSAKNKAAEPKNRLDRVIESMRVIVEETLDKKYSKAKASIASSRAKIKEATGTYAANGDEIVKAQNSLQAAEKALKESEESVQKVKTQTNFEEFTSTAANTFSKLNTVEENASQASIHAQNAINYGFATIGAGVAGTVGVGGAGFLFWRRRKDTKTKTGRSEKTELKKEKQIEHKAEVSEVHKEKPVEHKPGKDKQAEDKIDKKANESPETGASVAKIIHEHKAHKEVLECPKCGILKENIGAKFCEECGSPLRKKIHEHKKPLDACPKCNEKVTHKDKFCANCGENLKK